MVDVTLVELKPAVSPCSVLYPFDLNPLRDAASWLEQVPTSNGNYLNAQLTAEHIRTMIWRIQNKAMPPQTTGSEQ